MQRLCALLLCTSGSLHAAELAVVIDDLGYSFEHGMRAINLPGPVTLAVLPFAPNTPELTRRAMQSGKDLIVHLPMDAFPAPHVRTEAGTLTLGMDHAKFDELLNASVNAVPGSIGLSNHNGSLLTRYPAPMRRLMRGLSDRGFFFLDSRTTAATVALDIAREIGVPAVKRDVFLDHDPSPSAIAEAFAKAIGVSRRNGRAIIVGHPYPASLDYLEIALGALPNDVRLVPAKSLTNRAIVAREPDPDALRISPGR